MSNGKSMLLKRMAIAAVCVGMVGSGGLVQAMNTTKPVEPLKTGKITPVMTRMIDVPASKIASVPLGEDDKITRVNLSDFQIGKAEVTGALWSDVYNWAVKNGYTFEENTEYKNVGTDKPVTKVSWYDVIVWVNAYSEKSKLQPVYRSKGFFGLNQKILKDATDTKALDVVQEVLSRDIKKNGYRLLENNENEIAARWLGTTKPSKGKLATKAIATKGKDNKTVYYWTPAGYASGAIDDWKNGKETTRVAWFDQKSEQKVCTKATNVLGICDMSGNVYEWQFTSKFIEGTMYRGVRGGSWRTSISGLGATRGATGYMPSWFTLPDVGFRLARTVK